MSKLSKEITLSSWMSAKLLWLTNILDPQYEFVVVRQTDQEATLRNLNSESPSLQDHQRKVDSSEAGFKDLGIHFWAATED